MPSVHRQVLTAVASTGASAFENSLGSDMFTLYTKAASVTSGFTIDLEGSPDGSTWFQLTTRTVAANGNFADSVQAAAQYLRANVTARTDGTIDAWISAAAKGRESFVVS
jgi:hypothetical protein